MSYFLRRTILALGLALVCAGTAQAQETYIMSGKLIGQNTLAWVLPMEGDTPCPAGFIFGTGMQLTTPAPTTLPASQLMTKMFGANGCVPGGGTITTPGTGTLMADEVGGKFTVPVNFFSQMVPGMTLALALTSLQSIPQVASSWTWRGPPASSDWTQTMRGSMANGTNTAPWRVLQAGAWMNQSGRAGADFTWCPGGLLGGIAPCPSPNAGNRPLLIKNIGGSNPTGGFGGTMNLLFFTTGDNPSSFAQVQPLGGIVNSMSLAIGPIEPCGGAHVECSQTRMTSAFGRGYAAEVYQLAVVASVFSMYKLTTMNPVSKRLIGMVSGLSATTGPTAYQTSHNFPLTTGSVVVRQTGMTNLGMVNVITITGMGTDSITSMGLRNLQLVAGKVATAVVGGAATFDYVAVGYRQFPEPGRGATLLAGIFGLIGLAAWRSRRGPRA